MLETNPPLYVLGELDEWASLYKGKHKITNKGKHLSVCFCSLHLDMDFLLTELPHTEGVYW